MAAPDRREYRDLPVATVSEFTTVSAVKAALRDLELGMFARAASLVDAMGRDDRVAGVHLTRVQGLLGLPMEFEGGGDARRAKTVAKELQETWGQMFPEAELASLLRWGIDLGAGVGELVWERSSSRWTPRLKVWHPQHLWYRWDTRSYWLFTQDGPIELTPGNGKWVLYTPYGLYRGWMQGLVRALAIPYLIRQWGIRDWARYSEVHGLPIKKGKVPSTASAEDKERFLDELGALGSEATISLPVGPDGQSFDVLLEEAKADNADGFEKLLNKMEASIAIAVLGQNLTTEVKGGSRAAAQVHADIKQDVLVFDAESLTTAMREQAIRPWATFNFGDPDLAPEPCFETEPPEDEQAAATTLNTLGDALGKLQSAGIPVDLDEIAERFRIPVKAGAKAAPPPPAEPSPDAPEDGADEPPPEPTEDKGKRARASATTAPGVLAGQLYTDAIADAARDEAARALHPDVLGLLGDVTAASSYDDLRTRLIERYRGMSADRLAAVMERAMLLAELNGRYRIFEGL